MQTRLLVGGLAVLVLLGGCTAPSSPGTQSPEATSSPTASPPADSMPTSTGTPAPVDALPAPADCLTDAAPRPPAVDGVEPSAYPTPPTDVTRASLVNWTQEFETAYFRNELLAEAVGDDDRNLTEVSAYAEVRNVTHTTRGYVVRFSDSGATNYASKLHGDHWMDVAYVLNETQVVRVPLDDRGDPVRARQGTVVVRCP